MMSTIIAREPESFFPEAGALVTDDEDVEVIVFVINKLADLFQRQVDTLLVAREEIPTRSGVQLFRICIEFRWCINRWIDADRNEIHFLPHVSTKRFLQLLQISIQRQTTSGARGEERIDDDNFAL